MGRGSRELILGLFFLDVITDNVKREMIRMSKLSTWVLVLTRPPHHLLSKSTSHLAKGFKYWATSLGFYLISLVRFSLVCNITLKIFSMCPLHYLPI